MKNLNEINFSEITNDQNYLLHISENGMYGDSHTNLLSGSGSEVLVFLKDHFGFEEESDEDMLGWLEENNGDGDSYFSIFELED